MNIKIIYSKKHFGHDPQFEIYDGVYEPYAERAERITAIVIALREKGIRGFQSPASFPMEYIYEIHQKEYVRFLRRRSGSISENQTLYPSYFIMDTYTPITAKTFIAAKSASDVALTGAEIILRGERMAYALCRPPGHHADYKTMGGYCYFNNAAIAANYLSKHGRVAILDIDFHHGNGTQNIFYSRSDVAYMSIHADPRVRFPYSSGFSDERGKGDGIGFNKNYPLPLGTKNNQYLKTLKHALKEIHTFHPKFLVVSAGFDTYEKDPIGGFELSIPFYKTIGSEIAKLQLPTLIVQEGGYHIKDLGKIAVSFLCGIGSV